MSVFWLTFAGRYIHIMRKFIKTIIIAAIVSASFMPDLCAMHKSADEIPAATSDTVSTTDSFRERRKEKKAARKLKNFHYNILGGPSYSPDFGFLMGGSILMTFRTEKNDTTLKRSVMPFAVAVGMNTINITSKPQLFFKKDHIRLFGEFSYKISKENYYGVGYVTNKNTQRGKNTTRYDNRSLKINPYVLFRISDNQFYLGPQIDISYDKMDNPAEGILNDPDYIRDTDGKGRYTNFSSGIGIVANYDSRDVPANAYKGIFAEVRLTAYNRFLGSNTDFYKFDLDYRQYKEVGKRKVLAWTVQSKNVFGDVPISRLITTGTPYDLRGYYMGQYRDKTSHIVIAEYRQMFHSDKENIWGNIVRRLGWTVWGGCGFMGPAPARIEGLLPNAGIGLRIEVQPRMNIRLDFGRNFINKQNLFYFNITEAF